MPIARAHRHYTRAVCALPGESLKLETRWRSAVSSNPQATSYSRLEPGPAERVTRNEEGPSVRAPDLSTHLLVLLLASRLLRRCRRSIPFAETLPTPTIASFDEARSQVVRAAVAAHELLCFRLTPSLLHRRSADLVFTGSDFLPFANFARSILFDSPSAVSAGHGCLLCCAHEASDGRHVSSELPSDQRRWESEGA